MLGQVGIGPLDAEGQLSPAFVYLVSAIDTVVLVTLIFWLLRPKRRSSARCVSAPAAVRFARSGVGLALVPAALAVVMLLQIGIYMRRPVLAKRHRKIRFNH